MEEHTDRTQAGQACPRDFRVCVKQPKGTRDCGFRFTALGQLSMDGTSHVNGDSHARFCERLGVKLAGPTRRCCVTSIPTATLNGCCSS